MKKEMKNAIILTSLDMIVLYIAGMYSVALSCNPSMEKAIYLYDK